ncbi:hypothetical protein RCO48_16195 [Peribacillus frigoritolerans]|nr:hypothetical protein [Peribacillus frigoritolerans]
MLLAGEGYRLTDLPVHGQHLSWFVCIEEMVMTLINSKRQR